MCSSMDGFDSAKNEYEVGYCRPPKEHQFKPGQSGNPKGPPRHPGSFIDCLNRELSKTQKITINGRKRKETMLTIIVKQYITALANSNPEFFKLFLKYNADKVNIEKELYQEPTITTIADSIDSKTNEFNKIYVDALKQYLDELNGINRRKESP